MILTTNDVLPEKFKLKISTTTFQQQFCNFFVFFNNKRTRTQSNDRKSI